MRPHFLLPLLLTSIALPSPAQRLTLGVVAGTGLTDDFRRDSFTFPGAADQTSTFTTGPVSRGPIVGPKLELGLPLGFSVEADALHRPLRSTTTQTISPPVVLPNGAVLSTIGPDQRTHASWEFPILVRHRVPLARWRPFLEAGPSFRPAGTSTGIAHTGITVGAGVSLPVHSVTIAPALRYTRWREAPAFLPVANVNQMELVVGIAQGEGSSGLAGGFGRRLSVGLVAGVGLGDDLHPASSTQWFEVNETPDSNSLVAGLMVEVELHGPLSIEADGLYRPLHAIDTGLDGRGARQIPAARVPRPSPVCRVGAGVSRGR
jgi:hypothetical protein